jgi:SAM-dependent methyltransferase
MQINRQYVRTVTVFQPATNRREEVSREVSARPFVNLPQHLPPDAEVTVGLYTSQPADSERRYSWRETVQPDGSAMEPPKIPGPSPTKAEALFLAESQTLQFSGHNPAVLFCETLHSGPDDYQVQLLDGSQERSRYVRSNGGNYAGDPAGQIAKEVAAKTPESVKQWDATLAKTRGAFLEARYGERTQLSVLEVGPGTTGCVPRVFLKEGNDNHYTAIDLSPDALRMQQAVLANDGVDVHRMTQLVGDASKKIPVADASQDLVLGYSSIGTWGPTDEVKAAFDELARVLRPGGELLACGTGLDCASPPAIAHILSKFELIPQRETDQGVDYILRRRANS